MRGSVRRPGLAAGGTASRERRISGLACWTASTALWLVALWSSWNCVGLQSDGSAFFIEVIDRGWFVDYDPARNHTLGLWQIPLVAALRAGITDLQALAWTFSMATLTLPVTIYQLALLRARNDAVLLAAVIAAIASVFMTGCLFSVGEYSTAYAIAIATTAFSAQRNRPGLGDGLAVLALGVLAVRTYEIFVLLAPLLALLLIWRAHKTAPWSNFLRRRPATATLVLMGPPFLFMALSFHPTATLVICAGLAMLSALLMVRLQPRSTAHVVSSLYLVAAALFLATPVLASASIHMRGGQPMLRVLLSETTDNFWHNVPADLAFMSLGILVAFAVVRPALLTRRLPFVLAAVPLAALALFPCLQSREWPDQPLITLHYFARLPGSGVTAAIVVVAWLRTLDFRRRPRALEVIDSPAVRARGLAFALALMLAMMPATLYASFEWRRMLDGLRATIHARTGTIVVLDLPPQLARFFWDGSDQAFSPYLGRILQRQSGEAILAAPFDGSGPPVPGLPNHYWRD